jgi:hypothetical protein
LIFIFVDHFEPRSPEDVARWVKRYPEAMRRYVDSDGRPPRHSWFYDGEDAAVLDALGGLCRAGFGEIELHLHHSHDTSDGLREKLRARLRRYAEHGALITRGPVPKAAFGFIHGKWSLDNSRGAAHCGVNDELIVLRECGCYADFTFPAWGRMQPAMNRCIYYAKDDPMNPKSYDTGVEVKVGGLPSGDLMIIQGPTGLSGVPRKAARVPGLVGIVDRLIGTCAVDGHLPPTPRRVDRWVRAHVHVKGRPEWTFVKVHTHGARPENALAYFGEWSAMLHEHLGLRYNDGVQWRLHYATAREAYNIVKAAEAGKEGNPGAYRDFEIAPYRNTA